MQYFISILPADMVVSWVPIDRFGLHFEEPKQ